MMTATATRWLLTTVLFTLTSWPCIAQLGKRDSHSLVIPLAYEPTSSLMTASITIGSTHNTYNLIVDTGSPFLVLQNSSFRATSSTWDPHSADQPDLDGAQGYITTTPNANDKKGPVKPKIHFVTDVAWLNEASGQRAGAGAKQGNVTLGLTTLDDLKGAQGILGLSPPFSMVKSAGPSAPPQQQQKGAERQAKAKDKRDNAPKAPPASSASSGQSGSLPSLDVSFLHSYLSVQQRKLLGLTGSSHFYLDFSPASTESPTPIGELVLPLSGTTLPTSVSGYDYNASVTIDPSSGSTYPSHPFWGIAHRSDVSFFLNGTVLPDVKIDALLLDSGTSGIIAPPSEVRKIFAATQGSVTSSSPPNSQAVLGKTSCTSELNMGFSFGSRGSKLKFEAVRRSVGSNGKFVHAQHDGEVSQDDDWMKRGLNDSLTAWKSYVDVGIGGLDSIATGLTGWMHLPIIGKRRVNLHKRLLSVGLADTATPDRDLEKLTIAPSRAQFRADQCPVSLMGSPQVEAMFPSNGPDFKVWILGIEFFQSNLVYHNLDTAQTVIVPRTA